MVGCNAVGDSCCGKSKIVEPNGSTLIEASGTKEELLLATIDLAKLDEIRNKIPYLSDFKSDTFSIEALKNIKSKRAIVYVIALLSLILYTFNYFINFYCSF